MLEARALVLEETLHNYNTVVFDADSKVQTKSNLSIFEPKTPFVLIIDFMAFITTNPAVNKLTLDMRNKGGF